MTRKELLLNYILAQNVRYENDVVELQNKAVFRRNCDELDCLELIIAKSKLTAFNEFASDIMSIYKITKDDFDDIKI